MSAFITHMGMTAICPHGGQLTPIPSNTRVFINGQPALIQTDTFIIAGCVFFAGPKPQPCVTVKWIVPATRVSINGTPVILQNCVGLCQSAEQIPQGPPNVIVIQTRVKGM